MICRGHLDCGAPHAREVAAAQARVAIEVVYPPPPRSSVGLLTAAGCEETPLPPGTADQAASAPAQREHAFHRLAVPAQRDVHAAEPVAREQARAGKQHHCSRLVAGGRLRRQQQQVRHLPPQYPATLPAQGGRGGREGRGEQSHRLDDGREGVSRKCLASPGSLTASTTGGSRASRSASLKPRSTGRLMLCPLPARSPASFAPPEPGK